MNDYYLSFSDKEAAHSALSNYVREGELCGDKNVSIDVLYDVTLDDDFVVVSKIAKPGYLINIRSRTPLNLSDYEVHPLTPSRRWT